MRAIICLLVVTTQAYLTAGHACKQDPDYSCTDTQTCCLLPEGEGVGCCPFPAATCCSDRTHCCPNGLKCDVQAGRCVGDQYHLLLANIAPSKENKKEEEQITSNLIPRTKTPPRSSPRPGVSLFSGFRLEKFCPNKDYTCDDNQTCCPLKEGGYGCCPLGPAAVCCKDQVHCCPQGTQCDVTGGTCAPQTLDY